MVALPANLPNISKAKLPAIYEGAKTALAECARLDECQAWADKAEALASYAKQAEDSELRAMADRIQARAIRRCGELLREMQPATGAHLPNIKREGPRPVGRAEAARDAGMSDHQRKQALRVAAVPQPDFDYAVESQEPATVTKLAEMGTQAKPRPAVDLGGRDPAEFAMSTQAQGLVNDAAEDCQHYDPAAVVRGAFPDERKRLLASIITLGKWLVLLREELEA